MRIITRRTYNCDTNLPNIYFYSDQNALNSPSRSVVSSSAVSPLKASRDWGLCPPECFSPRCVKAGPIQPLSAAQVSHAALPPPLRVTLPLRMSLIEKDEKLNIVAVPRPPDSDALRVQLRSERGSSALSVTGSVNGSELIVVVQSDTGQPASGAVKSVATSATETVSLR